MAVDFRSSFRSLTLLLFFSSLGSVRLTAEYDRNFAETDNVQRSASISKERGISAALYSDLVAAAITKTSRRRIGETTAYPTSYPTGVYVAPTNPEEESNTPAPVADASDVPEQNSGEDPNAPVIGSGSTIEEQTSPPVAAPIEPPVEVDTDSSIPITGVAISDNYEIGGAQNINEEIKEEDRTALNSALYFFITLVVCLLCFGGIHIVKRYVRTKACYFCDDKLVVVYADKFTIVLLSLSLLSSFFALFFSE